MNHFFSRTASSANIKIIFGIFFCFVDKSQETKTVKSEITLNTGITEELKDFMVMLYIAVFRNVIYSSFF